MVIVVFGDEVRQVNQAHQRAESRMSGRTFEVAVVGPSQCHTA
jgi:hypothetical protein